MTVIMVTSNEENTKKLVASNIEEEFTVQTISVSNAPLSMADDAKDDRSDRTHGTVDKIIDTISETADNIAVVIDVDNVALSSYLVTATCIKINVYPPEKIRSTICEHLVDIMIPIGDTLVSFD